MVADAQFVHCIECGKIMLLANPGASMYCCFNDACPLGYTEVTEEEVMSYWRMQKSEYFG